MGSFFFPRHFLARPSIRTFSPQSPFSPISKSSLEHPRAEPVLLDLAMLGVFRDLRMATFMPALGAFAWPEIIATFQAVTMLADLHLSLRAAASLCERDAFRSDLTAISIAFGVPFFWQWSAPAAMVSGQSLFPRCAHCIVGIFFPPLGCDDQPWRLFCDGRDREGGFFLGT